MSVKRYQPVAQCVEPSYQAQMVEPKVMEFSEGEYVRWEDYDATCETLAHTETERDASDAEVQRLKAEVERLTKAGDAFSDAMDRLAMFANEDARLMARTVSLAFKDARNAAKEGRDL